MAKEKKNEKEGKKGGEEQKNKVPSLEKMQVHTQFIRARRKSVAPDSSSSSSEEKEEVLDIEAGEVDVHEYFKMQMHMHKHEDILREEIIDESKLPKGVRLKRTAVNHARVFLAAFSQKFFFRHRSLLTTIVEVFFSPLMVLLILSAFTHGISWDKAMNDRKIASETAMRFKDIDAERLKHEFRSKYCDAGGKVFLLFYPDTTLVRKILKEMVDEFDIEKYNRFHNRTERTCRKDAGCGENIGLIACSSEQELLELAMLHRKDRRKHREPLGVIFKYEGWESDKDSVPIIPKKLDYTIRVFNQEIEDTFTDFPRVKPPRSEHEVSPYITSGFLGLQYGIEEAYLEIVDDTIRYELLKAGGNITAVGNGAKNSLLGGNIKQLLDDPNFLFSSKEDVKAWPIRTFKMYYYPNFFGETLRSLITTVVSFTILTSYGFFTYSIVKQVVTENESGIKDLLTIHNMPMILHWVTLTFHTIVLRLVTAILITILLFKDFGNGGIIVKSNPILVFLFIYTHMNTLTFFNFFLSSTTSSIFMSGITAMVVAFAMYLIPSFLETIGLVTFYTNLILVALCPNWGFMNGLRQIIYLECDDKGVNFRNMFTTSPGQFLNFFSVIAILICSGIFYLAAAVMRDMTQQKSLAKSYKWYEFRKRMREKQTQKEDHDEMMADRLAHREDELPFQCDIYEDVDLAHHKIMVRVRNVSAYSGRHKAVLSHVSFNVHHGEITVILGHIGSGKSTLIHVMAGMRTPSHGYVTVHGYDVNFEKKQAHKYLGYCPQKNILFNLFTVQEHIIFCYRLRGMGTSEAIKHAVALLHLIRLTEVARRYPHDLSKKDKRKLCISLALVHAPKVMLLDEPTHGLDSMARREIWSILVELKHHHTIVIATNRMDEAEYLGDRIALLSHGKIICYGTPNYLKEQYDTGYYLKLYPAPDATLDVDKCFAIVESHIDEKPKVNQGGEEILEEDDVILELPKSKLHYFPDMLDELDSRRESLGLGHYTVAQVSLDDIFIRICDAIALENEPPDKSFRRACADTRRDTFKGIDLPKSLKHETFTSSRGNSVMALMHKRLAILKAKNDFFVLEYVFPVIIFAVVCWQNMTFIHPIPSAPAREMSLRTYGQARVFYRLGATDLPLKLNRNYKESLDEGMKASGVRLLKTEQVLIKLEDLNAWQDGLLREKHIVALEFRQLEKYEAEGYRRQKVKQKYLQFVGYHSSGALHSPPIAMNVITNVMLKAMLPPKSDFQISVSSHPFPLKLVSEFVRHCSSSCVLFAALISFGLSFFVAGTIVVPVIERRTGMKHLQLMTGLHPVIHWGTEFLFDVVISGIFGMVLSIFACTFSAMSFKVDWYMGMIASTVIFTLYLCWASITFVFFLSTILPGKLGGFSTYLFLHLLIGVFPIMMMEIQTIETDRASSSVIFLRNFLHIFPMYTVTSALHRWFELDARWGLCQTLPLAVQEMCKLTSKHGDHGAKERAQLYNFIMKEDLEFGQCCDRVCKSSGIQGGNRCFQPPSYFDWSTESFTKPMLWYHVVVLILQGIIYWGLLIFIERGFLTNVVHTAVLKFIRAHAKDLERPRPPDVKAERAVCEELVNKNEDAFPKDMALVCLDLTKSYATVMVVNDVSIAVKKGECIGILGGAGSGKTTLVKLLCGEVLATTGEVYIGNSSIHHHRVEFLKQIGYCPQNFCLFELFNPEQMLELMGRLRGVPAFELGSHVNQWLEIFGLAEVRTDRCKDLTVGMRRCVCAAMAAIGGCEVILMDEPTSGIDPASRQKFWAIVKLLTSYGRTVIFTTYNVEECVFLSSRMIVLCEGNVQALGPPRELVKRFARGFSILIRVRHDVLTMLEIVSTTMGRVAKLKKSMRQKFKHLTLRDEQDNLLLYFLRDLTITWGELFRKMEEVGNEHGEIIEKYYISEATLDEIFVMLTNKYREMDAPRRMEPRMAGTVTQKQAEKKALQRAMGKKK